jgi:hypothetical protein
LNVSTLLLTFENGIISDTSSEGLDFYRFYIPPCTYSIEYYNKILYLVDTGKFLSCYFKMSYYRSIIKRERDGLSMILVEFDITELT